MAPSIIYFLPKGGKKRSKKGKKVTNRPRGRLHVGYCLRDWCKVFYEPTDERDLEDDEAEVVPKFRFETNTANGSKRREPAEGEIAWLPHFDPQHIQTKKPKERDLIHKNTLRDAYRFLNEDDEERIRELKEELDDQNHRRWQTWFDEAIKFKETRLKTRARTRARRELNIRAVGMDPKGVEGLSDTSDDSAYESDSDDGFPPAPAPRMGTMASGQSGPMGPPPRLRPGQANKRPGGFNGRGSANSKRGRVISPMSPSSSSNHSGQSRLSNLGPRPRGGRPRGRSLGFGGPPAGRMFQEDSEDDDLVMSGASGDLSDGLPRNSRSRASSASVIDGSFPRGGTPANDGNAPGSSPPNGALPRVQNDENWLENLTQYQTGDEDAAYQRALRESSQAAEVQPLRTPPATAKEFMQPRNAEEEREQIERASRASMAPENRCSQAPEQTGQNQENGQGDQNGENRQDSENRQSGQDDQKEENGVDGD